MLGFVRERLDRQTGFVSAGLVLAVTAASLAFFFGQGATNHVLRLLPGGMWLLSHATNTVSHVNGASGAKDAEWKVRTAAGQNLQRVIDFDGSVIALDDQGNAHVISAQTGPGEQSSAALGGYELFVGSSTVYAAQLDTGEVQPRAGVKEQLAPLGDVVNVGGPIPRQAGAVVAANDVLVSAVPQTGTVANVDHTQLSTQELFTPNANIKIAVVRGRPVMVDLSAGVAKTLDGPQREIKFDPAGAGANTPVAGCDSCDRLVIGKAKSLVSINLATRTHDEIAVNVAGTGDVVEAVVAGGRAFVRDGAGHVTKIGLDDSKVEAVAGTFTDLHAAAGNVFLNDANSATAITVDKDGTARTVVKTTPESAQQAEADAAPQAVAQPAPPVTPPAPPAPAPAKTHRKPKVTPAPVTPSTPDTTPSHDASSPQPNTAGSDPAGPPPATGTGGSSEAPSSPPPTTPVPTPTPTPSAPGINAAAGSRGQINVTVTWSTARANGATIDHFTVNLIGGDTKTLTPAQLADGTATSTFTGLADSHAYTARATVHTTDGITATATDTATTPAAPTPPPPPPAPAGPWHGIYFIGVYGCANVRTAPRLNAGVIACNRNGDGHAACWTSGDSAFGTNMWFRLDTGGYVHSHAFQIDGLGLGSRPGDMPSC